MIAGSWNMIWMLLDGPVEAPNYSLLPQVFTGADDLAFDKMNSLRKFSALITHSLEENVSQNVLHSQCLETGRDSTPGL